jgi:hypothetical protein
MRMMMIGIIEIAEKRDYVVVGNNNNNNRNSVH